LIENHDTLVGNLGLPKTVAASWLSLFAELARAAWSLQEVAVAAHGARAHRQLPTKFFNASSTQIAACWNGFKGFKERGTKLLAPMDSKEGWILDLGSPFLPPKLPFKNSFSSNFSLVAMD
jgi:hypothetical protein